MRGSRRGRLGLVAALSLALHALVLVWLAWPQAPALVAMGPDRPLMSVELLDPPTARPERVATVARPAASGRSDAPAPRAEVREVEAVSSAAVGAAPATSTPGVSEGLRAALRATAGCAGAKTPEAREACEEKLGRMSASAPRYGPHMDPGKRAYYDEVAAAGASGRGYGDDQPGAVTPGGAAYFRGVNCSIKFGVGKAPKDRQGEVRLGRTPCSIPLQGSFFTPEASVRRR